MCVGIASQGWAATSRALRPRGTWSHDGAAAVTAALLDEAPPVADVDVPRGRDAIARWLTERVREEQPELVAQAQAWGERLQAATDLPAFLAGEAAPTNALQQQWLRLLRQLEPDMPVEQLQQLLFVDRDSWLARAFDLNAAVNPGCFIRLRTNDGSELRYALVVSDAGRIEHGERRLADLPTSSQGFVRGLRVALHELYHVCTYPQHWFPSLVEAQLHEGVVEYLARQAILRRPASDDLEMNRLRDYMCVWLDAPLSSFEEIQRRELGLSAPAADASTAARMQDRLILSALYPHLLALVDYLVQRLGEPEVLQKNRDGMLGALLTQVPQLADAHRLNEDLDGRSQLMERATIWSAVSAMLDVEPAEAKAHWDALVMVLSWLRRGSPVIDLERLIAEEIAAAEQKGQLHQILQEFPEDMPVHVEQRLEQRLRRDRVLTAWVTQLAAAPQSSIALQQRIQDELRDIVQEILCAPTDELPPSDGAGGGSSGSSQGGPRARVLRFEPAAPPSGEIEGMTAPAQPPVQFPVRGAAHDAIAATP